MKEVLMREHFGPFLADGDLGNKFRFCTLEPLWSRHDLMVFDFTGVTNLSDSFANACFGSLAEDHASEFVSKVRFKNCVPLIQSSLSAAVNAGLTRGERLVAS